MSSVHCYDTTFPTLHPTFRPTDLPSEQPTSPPTRVPTLAPTQTLAHISIQTDPASAYEGIYSSLTRVVPSLSHFTL